MTATRRFSLQSLRGRYLIVAALIVSVVITGTWIAHDFLSSNARSSTANIEIRNHIAHYSRLIRNSVWRAEYALLAFTLSPLDLYRQEVKTNLNLALRYAQALHRLRSWPSNIRPIDSMATLITDLERLRVNGRRLMDIRATPLEMFPAMHVMTGGMVHENIDFYSAATESMDDLADATTPSQRALYRQLSEVRHAWTLMIVAFRVYVANRLGTFGDPENGLLVQSRNVKLLFGDVQRRLALLDARARRTDLGLQGNDSLARMHTASERWFASYQQVRKITESNHWRMDVPYLNSHIQPLLTDIRGLLEGLDRDMERSARMDAGSFRATAQRMANSQVIEATLVLLFVALGSIYLERHVLRPISRVSRALKAASQGDELEEIPAVGALEARQLIEAFQDMHKKVNHRQSALEHQALHDSLTSLPNRVLLQDRLQQAILAAARSNGQIALLMLDLDRFKEINDTLGHHVGDMVLRAVATRLQRLLRKSDTVARLGGDEFAILLPMADLARAEQIAERVLQALEREMTLHQHKLYTSGSLGIALYPQHGASSQTLIKRADVAMYAAKRSNDGFCVYDVAGDQHSVARLSMITELHGAIERDELLMHYQPKLDLVTRRVVGVEALLRWKRPALAEFGTADVIALAEQTGIIKPLTQWVLARALAECTEWLRAGLDLGVSVNLSVWNLQDRNLVAQTREMLSEWKLPPGFLTFEITESAMMAEPDRALDTLTQLDRMGIALSVDDFGTGFSSLGYLKKLPVDELKIDRSFVINMTEDENDATIVRSTIDLAHNLGLKVVAEGVEDARTLELLQRLSCDTAQGYHIARPMPAAELSDWLSQYNCRSTALPVSG